MNGIAERYDIAAFVQTEMAVSVTTVTAGGDKDGVYFDTASIIIDRHSIQNPQSAEIAVPIFPTLASGQTAKVKIKVQDSDESAGTYADYDESDETTIGESGVQALVKFATNLVGAKQFIKIALKVTLSAANTDTAVVAALGVFEAGKEF